MISGYVIFFSANHKTAGQFLAARSVRLYPAFWAAVIFTTVIAQFWGGMKMSVSFPQAIANLTMFPKLFGYEYVDGVYWTLQYEWMFYFAVCAALIVGIQERLRVIFLLWPLFILLANLTHKQGLPYMDGYYSYFAAGSLFAIQKEYRSRTPFISLLVCLYLCISFSVEKASSSARGIEYSALTIGLIVCALFLFFIVLNSSFGSSLKLIGSRLAGGLTYPVYLIHAHFGYMFISRFATNDNKLLIYSIAISMVLALAYLIHIIIERRLAELWHMLFSRSLGAIANALQRRVAFLRLAIQSKI